MARLVREEGLRLPFRARWAAAVFVALTTTGRGRFIGNAKLTEAGAPRQTALVLWGALNITGPALKRSLRVEHLAENLAHVVQQ